MESCKEDQATDRAYRMGQKRSVSVYRLLSESTIEQTIDGMHKENSESILSDQEVSRLDSQALLDLISS